MSVDNGDHLEIRCYKCGALYDGTVNDFCPECRPRRFGIWAERAPSSMFGAAAAWLKSNGELQSFDTMEEAEANARALNARTQSMNVYYTARKMRCEGES